MSGFDWLLLLDRPALAEALRRVTGRKFLGVVNCDGAVELVFGDGPRGTGNLITLFTAGPRAGEVWIGGVEEPDGYVAANAEFGPEVE